MVLFVRTVSKVASVTNVQAAAIVVRRQLCTTSYLASISNTRKKSGRPSGVGLPGTLIVDKNIRLRFSNSSLSQRASTDSESLSNIVLEPRTLVVFFSWMLAKEEHLEKYRDLYFKHGFDVLTIKTSPMQLFLPTIGSQRVAENVVSFLRSHIASYPKILIHGFSVGGYQFGEVLVNMTRGLFSRDVDANLETLKNNIKGMIFDSAVDIDGIPYGFSRAMVGNSPVRPLVQGYISTHMKVFHQLATKHYQASSRSFHNTFLRCPALFLCSHKDPVGTPSGNEKVANRWRELGVPVDFRVFEQSGHVSHLHKYPEEYKNEVDNFLKKIKLI